MTGEQPWMKFYPSDWRADPALRMCSLAARGLWMEMLALCHEGSPYGHLAVNGRQVTAAQLAVLVGAQEPDVAGLLAELDEAGVFSRRRDGTIYSRRMVRDAKKGEISRKNGRKGGNPTLCKQSGISVRDNPQKPEARSQRPDTRKEREEIQPSVEPYVPPSAPAALRSGHDLDEIEAKCREAAGLETDPAPGLLNLAPIIRHLDAGVPLATILAVLRTGRAAGRSPRTWSYFDAAIRDALTDRAPQRATAQAPPAGISKEEKAALYERLNADILRFSERAKQRREAKQ